MNPTIKKGLEEVWEEADKKFEKQPDLCTPRELLVKDGNNPWGKPIEEIVDIVFDDIEGMPWARDPKPIKKDEVSFYLEELKEAVIKKIDWRKCRRYW